jgi:hypothetical protein
MPLSRDQILSVEDLTTVAVEVPEWGGVVVVRMLTAGERDRFETDLLEHPGQDVRARLVAATACDESGQLLFTAADVGTLTRKGAAAMTRLFAASARLNRITAKDVEELAGNS